MAGEWLRWLRLPVAALALLSAPLAHAQPAAAPATPARSTAGRDPARVNQLLQRIKQLTELPSPLSVDKALAILETRKGSSREAGKYNREWALAPTGLIAGGRIGHGTNRPYAYLEITPAPSLGLTFEDVAQLLLHAPYTMVERQVHAFEDSLATRIQGIYHTFLVPAGEAQIYLPSSAPYDAPDQTIKAWREGQDTARGSGPLSTRPVESVTIATPFQPRGTNLKTLAAMRAAGSARGAKAATK